MIYVQAHPNYTIDMCSQWESDLLRGKKTPTWILIMGWMTPPTQRCVYILIPRTCDWYLIWEKGLCRYNYLKNLGIRSSWITQWVLNEVTGVLTVEGQREVWDRTEEKGLGEGDVKTGQRLERCGYKPRNAKDCQLSLETWREAGEP